MTITAIVVDAILAGGVVARAWSGYLAVLVRQRYTTRAAACEVGSRCWLSCLAVPSRLLHNWGMCACGTEVVHVTRLTF